MVVNAPESWWVLPLMIVVSAIALTLFIMFDKDILDGVVWVLTHFIALLPAVS